MSELRAFDPTTLLVHEVIDVVLPDDIDRHGVRIVIRHFTGCDGEAGSDWTPTMRAVTCLLCVGNT